LNWTYYNLSIWRDQILNCDYMITENFLENGAECQWFMPVILVTWEDEIRRINI
jgi:hypothetical protein